MKPTEPTTDIASEVVAEVAKSTSKTKAKKKKPKDVALTEGNDDTAKESSEVKEHEEYELSDVAYRMSSEMRLQIKRFDQYMKVHDEEKVKTMLDQVCIVTKYEG